MGVALNKFPVHIIREITEKMSLYRTPGFGIDEVRKIIGAQSDYSRLYYKKREDYDSKEIASFFWWAFRRYVFFTQGYTRKDTWQEGNSNLFPLFKEVDHRARTSIVLTKTDRFATGEDQAKNYSFYRIYVHETYVSFYRREASNKNGKKLVIWNFILEEEPSQEHKDLYEKEIGTPPNYAELISTNSAELWVYVQNGSLMNPECLERRNGRYFFKGQGADRPSHPQHKPDAQGEQSKVVQVRFGEQKQFS